jgi:hypothetical protein
VRFHPLTNRNGVALPLALFTIVIAAVKITAVFFVGRLEQRMGNNSIAATQAFETAETGVATVLTSWVPASYNSMASGTSLALPTVAAGGSSTYTATIRRLSSSLFLIQSEGRFLVGGQPITRRQVARVVRLDPPSLDPDAALVTRWGLEVNGNATVNGRDSVPATWGPVCPAPGSVVAAIIDSAGTTTTTGPCTGQTCLTGAPPILTDPSAASEETITYFGSSNDFGSLAASADKIAIDPVGPLGPVIDPGSPPTCRIGEPTNWGDPLDPTGPCGNYYPVIYAPGDLTLGSGWAQGMLLVQGNLTLTGSLQFYGIIIVMGTVNASGGQVLGTLMIVNELGAPAVIGGTTQLSFSRCATGRAVTGAARPRPIHERGWVELY